MVGRAAQEPLPNLRSGGQRLPPLHQLFIGAGHLPATVTGPHRAAARIPSSAHTTVPLERTMPSTQRHSTRPPSNCSS